MEFRRRYFKMDGEKRSKLNFAEWGCGLVDLPKIPRPKKGFPPYPPFSISILKSFLKSQNFLTFKKALFRMILYYKLLTVFICFLIILFYCENIFVILK